jgi:hypothetical protein
MTQYFLISNYDKILTINDNELRELIRFYEVMMKSYHIQRVKDEYNILRLLYKQEELEEHTLMIENDRYLKGIAHIYKCLKSGKLDFERGIIY